MSHPLLYEINTRCWLHELSEQHAAQITLANVPETEFARWRHLGFTHVWLMGVWSTGPRSQAFTRQLRDLRQTYARLLPNFSDDDFVGSAYAASGYQVSESLGGEPGLNEFRKKLAANGLKLILDFIPNHTGLDHPWLKERPELFVQSGGKVPGTFRDTTSQGPRWIAHGKDPYFPAWADTAQLDYRNPATRAAMIEELKSVARRCDGVRCDMAMLVLNDVFARTWAQFPTLAPEPRSRRREEAVSRSAGLRPGAAPPAVNAPGLRPTLQSSGEAPPEFWTEAISTIKAAQPGFFFLAEAYWGLEPRLLDLGFDFAYDKPLTDHLTARRSAEAQHHLLALGQGGEQSSPRPASDGNQFRAHFLENHDEPRIASILSIDEHRAAALLILGLPGMRLLHEGQLTGATLRASVHLRRRPTETPRPDISALYETLLTTLQTTSVGQGHAELLKPTPAWQGNPTAGNIIVVQWQSVPLRFEMVVVNLAPHPSQCYVKLTVDGLAGRDWAMTNILGQERYERHGAALRENGLYLDLPAHAAQLFHFEPLDLHLFARNLDSGGELRGGITV